MPDWVKRLRLRKRKRELQKNSDHVYEVLEADAVKADTLEKRRDVESLRQFLCAQFDDEIAAIESRELLARAKHRHIDVSDLGPPEHEDNWIHGVHGAWFLEPKFFRALSRIVEEAEYQGTKRRLPLRDFWWKFVTAIAAVIAAIASLLNYVQHR